MFRSTAHSLRVWWEAFSDDILGADLAPVLYAEDLEHRQDPHVLYHRTHPHRQRLVSQRRRREGSVPARPAHCVSPVRAQDPAADVRSGSARN